jgi:nucleotide-binding universal stress UspA family protein
MKKILVPTDFSANSKSGIRFAIYWASLQKLELVFIHVLHILRPSQWTDIYFAKYAEEEEKFCKTKFEKFIGGIYRNMNANPGKHSFVIIQGISADITILDYCRKNHDIEYICVSTRGAGKFNKIFGTNTGNLITKSQVPVIAIPKTYKVADVKSVLYASDFHNYPEELNRVVCFALPLKAKIEVVHFTWPDEIIFDEKIFEAALKNRYKYGLKVHYEKNDGSLSIVQHIQKQIKIRKPSVVIMFTNQDRTFFQKLFLSSKAEELSFQLKVPLLVFNKRQTK